MTISSGVRVIEISILDIIPLNFFLIHANHDEHQCVRVTTKILFSNLFHVVRGAWVGRVAGRRKRWVLAYFQLSKNRLSAVSVDL